MKEAEATAGEKLCALVAALNGRTSFATALKRMQPWGPARTSWDDMADILQRGQVESLGAKLSGTLGVTDLHRKAASSHPKLRRGQVWCLTCGRTEKVTSAVCMANGWPECCGQTMTIDSPAERTT